MFIFFAILALFMGNVGLALFFLFMHILLS